MSRRYPLLPVTLLFTIGIVLFNKHWLVALALAASGWLFCKRPIRANGFDLTILLIFLAVGFLRAGSEAHLPDNHISFRISSQRTEVVGTVVGEPRILPGRTMFTLAAEQCAAEPVTGLVEVSWRGPYPRQLVVGSRWRLRGKLERASSQNNPGAFDYQAALARRGVHAVMLLRRPHHLEFLGGEPSAGILQKAGGMLRRKVLRTLDDRLSPANAALAAGLLLGDDKRLSDATRDAFSLTGTVHVLSVSGLHMAALGWLLLEICLLIGFNRKFAALLTLVGLAILSIACGLEPATVRAAAMASVYLLAIWVQRVPCPVNTVALAALVLLAAQPSNLFDAGFQLSFACVAGFVVFLPLLRWKIEHQRGLGRHGITAVAVSLIAQVVTWPMVAQLSSVVSLISLLANLLVTPLLIFCTLLGFGLCLLAGLPFSEIGFMALGGLLDFAQGITRQLSSLPGAWLPLAPPPPAFLFGYYLALAGVGKRIYEIDQAFLQNRFRRNRALDAGADGLPSGNISLEGDVS